MNLISNYSFTTRQLLIIFTYNLWLLFLQGVGNIGGELGVGGGLVGGEGGQEEGLAGLCLRARGRWGAEHTMRYRTLPS